MEVVTRYARAYRRLGPASVVLLPARGHDGPIASRLFRGRLAQSMDNETISQTNR
jgi:hypothetical protein